MAQRQLPEDFKDFIKFLNAHDVKYLLVGGWAVGLYGNPRATKDIDFLIGIGDENIKKLQKALFQFGAPTVEDKIFKEIGCSLNVRQPKCKGYAIFLKFLYCCHASSHSPD